MPRFLIALLLLAGSAAGQTVYFPADDLFLPPIADQRQSRTHISFQQYDLDFGGYTIGSVGYGTNFGIVRWRRAAQIGVDGSVQAIFNMDAESMDLINADYFVGIPLTLRRGDASARVRVFHLSSHLGDEFLLLPQPIPPPPRKNLSFEALDVLASWEHRGVRVYGGGFVVLHSTERMRQTVRAQAGLEYRRSLRRGFVFLSGADLARAAAGGGIDASVKTGIQLPVPTSEHTVQFLLELYDGRVPHGQFFEEIAVRYVGLSVVFVH